MFTNLSPELAAARQASGPQPDATERFMRLLQTALAGSSFVKLLLSGYAGEDAQLQRLTLREVQLKGERFLSFLWRYQTKDITKNHPLDEGCALLAEMLGTQFRNAHLQTVGEEVQLAFSRKGRPTLRVTRLEGAAPLVEASHDREKQRQLDPARPFWLDLGLTHEVKGAPQVIPAMGRKWKQINRFIEIFSAALEGSALAEARTVHVSDFGSGRGTLTFAMYDWLGTRGKQAQVTGIELRDDMVALCGGAAAKNGLGGLRFDQGDVRSYTPEKLDVMIALHACDIATDYAIHLGLRAGAEIIMCSPCCHKEVRPQMKPPALLRPLLQHGIHLGQEAEMVTDSLRALLLEAEGYETQVFEFISLEHTAKNKMILAVKKQGAAAANAKETRPEILGQIAEIKRFYGLREQCLETLLRPSALDSRV